MLYTCSLLCNIFGMNLEMVLLFVVIMVHISSYSICLHEWLRISFLDGFNPCKRTNITSKEFVEVGLLEQYDNFNR